MLDLAAVVNEIIKQVVYCAAVLSVPSYNCQTCSLRAEFARHFEVFEHQYIRSVAMVAWND